MNDLRSKTVLVTGGSRGIGAAIAQSVAAAGARVIIQYARRAETAEKLRQTLGAERCHILQADLSQATAAPRLWEGALEIAPRIDVLVNNAGIYTPAPIAMAAEEWRQIWLRETQVNLLAPAELCRLAIHHFRQHGGGRIINVASRAAHRGETPDHWPYAASKAGLVAMTKTIARGYAGDNILAFAIAPGYTETEMAYEGQSDEQVRKILADIPLGSMASPIECGALAAFLCSDVVRHLTGATFDINGASYVR